LLGMFYSHKSRFFRGLIIMGIDGNHNDLWHGVIMKEFFFLEIVKSFGVTLLMIYLIFCLFFKFGMLKFLYFVWTDEDGINISWLLFLFVCGWCDAQLVFVGWEVVKLCCLSFYGILVTRRWLLEKWGEKAWI